MSKLLRTFGVSVLGFDNDVFIVKKFPKLLVWISLDSCSERALAFWSGIKPINKVYLVNTLLTENNGGKMNS